jgi:hypothetical protein
MDKVQNHSNSEYRSSHKYGYKWGKKEYICNKITFIIFSADKSFGIFPTQIISRNTPQQINITCLCLTILQTPVIFSTEFQDQLSCSSISCNLKLSQQLMLIEISRSNRRDNWLKLRSFRGPFRSPHQILMTETDMVPATSVFLTDCQGC